MDIAELRQLDSDSCREALHNWRNEDSTELAMRAQQYPDLPMRALCEQIRLRQRAKRKIGPWAERLLFTSRSLEQTSSYATARYKAQLAGQPGRAIDLCAGLGMDSLCLAQAGWEVIAAEKDPLLAALLVRNAKELALPLAVRCEDGLRCLAREEHIDLIYADPDRRSDGRRHTRVEDYVPDLIGNAHAIRSRSQQLMLKLAPAAEPDQLLRVFPGNIHGHWVGWAYEARELLLRISTEKESSSWQATACQVDQNGDLLWEFAAPHETLPHQHIVAEPQQWFMEPDSTIIAANLVSECFAAHQCSLLHPAVAFATASQAAPNFPGRAWPIRAHGLWNDGSCKKYLAGQRIRRARITRRHFPLEPAAILKKLKLREGGNDRIICMRDEGGTARWIAVHDDDVQRPN